MSRCVDFFSQAYFQALELLEHVCFIGGLLIFPHDCLRNAHAWACAHGILSGPGAMGTWLVLRHPPFGRGGALKRLATNVFSGVAFFKHMASAPASRARPSGKMLGVCCDHERRPLFVGRFVDAGNF